MRDHLAARASKRATLSCEQARAAIRRFAAGEDAAHERTSLRAHMADCEPCREHYHEVVLTLGRLARVSLRAIEEAESSEPPPRRRVSLLAPRAERRLSWRVKALLLGAAVAGWFMAVRPDRAGDRVRLESLGGDVRHGDEQLAADGRTRPIERRKACSTGAGARARLSSGESSLLLAPATAVIVENERALRVHLLEGELEIDGDAEIVTEAGVVICDDGSGSVRLRGATLHVSCARRTLSWVDARGRNPIVAGRELSIESPAAPRTD